MHDGGASGEEGRPRVIDEDRTLAMGLSNPHRHHASQPPDFSIDARLSSRKPRSSYTALISPRATCSFNCA